MGNEIKHFTDLNAWKRNHELVLMIYKATEKFPKDEKYGMISQLKRASSSITANITEGWGRYHFADKNRFYYQARGSSTEVQSFIILASDLNYIDADNYKQLKIKSFEGFKLINGLNLLIL